MDNLPVVTRLVYRPNSSAFVAGILASLFDTMLFSVARLFGITTFSSELITGAFLTGNHELITTTSGVWMTGLVAKLFFGGVIAWIYSLGFRLIQKSGWDVGMALGGIHWIIAGTLLGIVTRYGRIVQDPGFYAGNFGFPTFSLNFVSHLLFGAIVGGLFLPSREAVLPIDQYLGQEKKFKRAA